MRSELDDLRRAGVRATATATVGVVAAVVVAVGLRAAPTVLAAVATIGVVLVVAAVRGPTASIPAAIVGCYIFGDHHLAGAHGVLGTTGAAAPFLLVQVAALAAASVGNRSFHRRTGSPASDPVQRSRSMTAHPSRSDGGP